jgi:hypothetical protein
MLTSRPAKPGGVLKAAEGSVLIYLWRWVRLNQLPELSFTMASMP